MEESESILDFTNMGGDNLIQVPNSLPTNDASGIGRSRDSLQSATMCRRVDL